jgi:hypothetical protein
VKVAIDGYPHPSILRANTNVWTSLQVVQLPDTYLQSMHIWYLWDRAADRIMAKHQELVDAGWPHNTTVVLDLPCPFLSIM